MKEIYLPNGKRLVFSECETFVLCDIHPPMRQLKSGHLVALPPRLKTRLILRRRTAQEMLVFNCRPYKDRRA